MAKARMRNAAFTARTEEKGEEEKKRICFLNRRPEFFKVFQERVNSCRLRIPPAFIDHFNGTVPNKAILKHSTGRCCCVKLEELKLGLFISSGWQSFVNVHFIRHGDSLIFKYDGGSVFEVTVFGPSGCVKEEVEVTFNPVPEDAMPVKVEDESESEEEEPSRSPAQNRRQKVSETSPEFKNQGLGEHRRSQRRAEMHSKACELFESEGLELPENPFFLGSLSVQYSQNIPKYVVSEHHITMKEEIVIHGKNGKAWPARVTSRSRGRAVITSGWINFVRGNHVGPRDKLVLEFILCRGRICEGLRAYLFPAGNRKGRRYSTRS